MMLNIKLVLATALCLAMIVPVSANGSAPLPTEKLETVISAAQREPPLEESITRGELISILNRTFDIYSTVGDKFTDSHPDHPYYYDMMAAKTDGYLTGYADGSAKPDQTITRAEAAVLINRLIDDIESNRLVVLEDTVIPDWALSSIQRVVALGVMPVTDGFFYPNDNVTRAEGYEAMEAIVDLNVHRDNTYEMMTFTSHDGHALTGRLSLPTGTENVETLVVFISGTGPSSYIMQREADDVRFNYVDVFAQQAAKQDMAYFSFSHRGVATSDVSPFYQIDEAVYQTYTPTNIAKDTALMVEELREDPRLKDAEIALFGWSEGAIIAPLAVAEYGLDVDALLLAGYPNENIREILDWQLGGGQTFFIYSVYFDHADPNSITRQEYETDPYGVLDIIFGGSTFDETDVDLDGLITANDFKIMNEPLFSGLHNAIKEDDAKWIEENFLKLYPEWFEDHFNLPKTEDILVEVDIPIYMFHGTVDLNCPVVGVYDAQARFESLNKDNLQVNIFENHNHDLNFLQWLFTGEMSEAIQGIFDTLALI